MIEVEKKCIVCNKSYKIIVSYKSLIKSARNTCSNECRYKIISLSVSKPKKIYHCKYCNDQIIVSQSIKRTFCSRKCKSHWQSENLSGKNNPNWKPYNPFRSADRTIRKHILKERKICEHCGSYENLQIHHVDQNRKNNSKENLLLLCQICHANKHRDLGDNHTSQFILNHPQSNGRRTYLPKPCEYCKNLFHPYRNNLRFCSHICAVKYRYQTPHKGRVCLFCKRTFIYKHRKQGYCSSKCRYNAASE